VPTAGSPFTPETPTPQTNYTMKENRYRKKKTHKEKEECVRKTAEKSP
jgi:hypothetical protein